MKLEQVNSFNKRVQAEIAEGGGGNSKYGDDNVMAPIDDIKSDYLRFMNFQRFYVFDYSTDETINEGLLNISQWRRLIQLMSFLYSQYTSKSIGLSDIKGIWSIISFFFPQRTGLFVSQFYSMIINGRESCIYEMYENSQERRQVEQVINAARVSAWFKDAGFNQSMQVLVKQARVSNYEQQTKLLNQFVTVRNTLSTYHQFIPLIQSLNYSIHNFDIFQPKCKQPDLDIMRQVKDIVEVSIFQHDEERYVLSEPDTLAADICINFQEQQYHHIKRKLSEDMGFDDQTQTHVYQTTEVKKITEKKLHQKQQQQKIELNQLSKYKRKLKFNDPYHEQCQQQTIPICKQLQKKKPRPKYHLSKMIQNQRRIEKKNAKRVKKNRKVETKKRMKKRQNFFLEKQIKKIYFDESAPIRREKRIIPNKSRGGDGNVGRRQEFDNWNERFVEDESVAVDDSSSRMEIEQEELKELPSSKYDLRRPSKQKRQQRRLLPHLNHGSPVSKQVKRRVSGARRQQKSKQSHFIVVDDQCLDLEDSKTKQKLPRKTQHQQKSHQTQLLKQQLNKQKITSQEFKSNHKKQSFKKKGRQFTRLRKQTDIQKSQFEQSESLSVNHDQMIENSETINFQKNDMMSKVNKRTQVESRMVLNQKYMHLYCNNKRDNNKKDAQKKKVNTNTLDNFLISSRSQQTSEVFEPLQGIQVRKLAIFQFQQSQRVTQRMMITENQKLTQYQRMMKDFFHYKLVNETRMTFSVSDYMSYLQSLETSQQFFKQVKEIANEYLSKCCEPKIDMDSSCNTTSGKQNNDLKLVLVSRKLLAFYILIRKQQLLQSQHTHHNSHMRYSSFDLTYIRPLLGHYFYKILINIFGQIVNSLFSSQGDEDFSLLNKVSLPFLMLVYDIRQLACEQSLSGMGGFITKLYEEIYNMLNEQAVIIIMEILLQLNARETVTGLRQKISKILHNQNTLSLINLPRTTISLLKRVLKVNLHPIDVAISCFTAFTLFEIGVSQKLALIFTTEKLNLVRLQEIRQAHFDNKGQFIEILQTLAKTALALNIEDKGIQWIRNLSYVIDLIFEKISFELGPSQFSIECKVITCLIRSFRQCSQHTSQVTINSALNRKKMIQNALKEETLGIIKKILSCCLRKFIDEELHKKTNFPIIMNLITVQKLPELKLNFPLNVRGEGFIQIDLHLEMVSVLMSYSQFRQNTLLCKPYVLNPMSKILKETRSMTFAGKHKLNDMVRRMFNLAMVGYRFHLLGEKGKIWQANDLFLQQQTRISLQKKGISQDYWSTIRQLFHTIYEKCKQYEGYSTTNTSGLRHFSSDIYSQKYSIYSNLLNEMLDSILVDIANDQVYNGEELYKNCNEQNCLSYSFQHLIQHVMSLTGEYNSFVDIDFISLPNQQKLDYMLSFSRVSSNLSKLTRMTDEITANNNDNNLPLLDNQERQEKLLEIAMDRESDRKVIKVKLIEMMSLRLQCDRVYQIVANKGSVRGGNLREIMRRLSAICAFQLMKPLLDVHKQALQNNQNQKQLPKPPKSSLFAQFVKHYQYLAWIPQLQSSSYNNNTNLHKELHDDQFQHLQTSFQFFYFLSKFLTEIHGMKLKNDVLMEGQFMKRMLFEFYHNKNLPINYLTGVILKMMIACPQKVENTQYHKSVQKCRKQVDGNGFKTLVLLWCKIFQTLHPSSLTSNQQSDPTYFLFTVFQLMAKKRQNPSETKAFDTFLQCCLETYTSKYHNSDQRLRNMFNSFFNSICQFIYSYMKQSMAHVNRFQQQGEQQNPNQKRKKIMILQLISKNYIKLLSTVMRWPLMLTTTIQKLKTDIQCLSIPQLNSTLNSTRGLADNLIIIGQIDNHVIDNKPLSLTLGNDFSSLKNITQSIQLMQQCIRSSGLLEANIYKIKQTLPNCLFMFLLRKIIEQQIWMTSVNGSKKVSVMHCLIGRNRHQQGDNNKKQLPAVIILLKQVIDSLSQFRQQTYLLSRLVSSFLRCFDMIKSTQTTLQASSSELMQNKWSQQQMRWHELGKRKVTEYRMRVLMTILVTLKQSTTQRRLIENLVWESIVHIERFIKDKFQQERSLATPFAYNILPPQQQQRTTNPSLLHYIQQIIFQYMIGRQSDFYLIKMAINSRIQRLLDVRLNMNIDRNEIRYRFELLEQALNRAIYISQGINNQQHADREVMMRCNADLEEWFREKINMIRAIKNSIMLLLSQTYQVESKSLREALLMMEIQQQQCFVTKMQVQN